MVGVAGGMEWKRVTWRSGGSVTYSGDNMKLEGNEAPVGLTWGPQRNVRVPLGTRGEPVSLQLRSYS